MARKFFLIVDTETTITDKVADLGIVVADKQGNIHYDAGLLVRDFYLDSDTHTLFHDQSADPLWGRRNLPRRYADYQAMIDDGRRMLASVAAVNRLLVKIRLKYNPTFTAYNIGFDAAKLENSGIDMSIFDQRFCLWHAAAQKWAKTKAYRAFALNEHLFGARTKHGNMTIKTGADFMARFLLGPDLPPEPHTALEDARDYELPILKALVKNTSPKIYMNPEPYNWKNYLVRDAYKPV